MPAITLRPARFARPRLMVRGLITKLLLADALFRSRHRLAELDDRMLRDIGLNRGDVADELRRPLL